VQLDIEMSFAGAEDVMKLVEDLVHSLWKSKLSVTLPRPFKRITYHQAMATYGSDKPDLRLGMEVRLFVLCASNSSRLILVAT
jgi:aspartyl-tRNA synthetase